MKHLRILGLALAAAFALSAVVAAAASANSFAPELAKCVKAAKVGKTYTGKFGNKTCTESATEGKYELASAEGAEFTGKSKATTLHAVSAAGKAEVIVCKKDVIKGSITGPSHIKATVTFEDCANEKKEACGTGGTIESNGAYGLLLVYLNEAQTEDGVISESPMESFSCGSEHFELEGILGGTIGANGKATTVGFGVNGSGEQEDRFTYAEKELAFGPDYLYTEAAGEHEATLVGAEELKIKGVYIVN
jgi:hypothetical protein